MKCNAKIWVTLAAATLPLAGCEQTATKQVRVNPPAATPVPAPDYARLPLPLPESAIQWALLTPAVRPEIDVLVDKVQDSYDAGQSELKAGHPDKAQADLDRAADSMLASGLPAESDPRLL